MSIQLHLQRVIEDYDRGEFETADARLSQLNQRLDTMGGELAADSIRYHAWLRARRGFTDGPLVLAQLYQVLPRTLLGITDYCCVYRFRGLVPDLERMIPWIDHGHARLEDHDNSPETVVVFRDHVANALLRNGELDRPWQSSSQRCASRCSPG